MNGLSISRVPLGTVEALLMSGEFDPFWYEESYPDVRMSGLGPAEHYILIGRRLGRAATLEEANKGQMRGGVSRPGVSW